MNGEEFNLQYTNFQDRFYFYKYLKQHFNRFRPFKCYSLPENKHSVNIVAPIESLSEVNML